MPALALFRPLRSLSRRERRVCIVLLAVALIGLADLELTLTYASTIGFAEANPLARFIMAEGTRTSVLLFKLGSLLTGVGILLRWRAKPAAEFGAWTCLAVMGWLTWQWTAYIAQVPAITPMIADGSIARDATWVQMIDP